MTTTTVTVNVTSKKGFQNALRALIVVGSLSGFLGGWILLAHSGKPVSGASASPDLAGPTLAPLNLQSLAPSGSTVRSFQPLQSLPSTSFSLPRLRTRGS